MRYRLGFLVVVVVFAFGCSTSKAVKSPRHGMLDSLASYGNRMERVPFRAKRAVKTETSKPHQRQDLHVVGLQQTTARWGWPVKDVDITSPFGQRGKGFHEGVDLKAKDGTGVFASEGGTVIYAGQRIGGYGKMVVLKHSSRLFSVYAHNSRLFVTAGQRVKKGQQIALSGQSGRVAGPHLHFEIRDGTKPLDPVRLLMPHRSLANTAESVSRPQKMVNR